MLSVLVFLLYLACEPPKKQYFVESWHAITMSAYMCRVLMCNCVNLCKCAAEKQEAGWKILLPSYCFIVAFLDKQGIYHDNCLLGKDVCL